MWTDNPFEALARVVAVATLPAGILAAMFLGGQAAGAVFVVGWLLMVPVLGVLAGRADGREESVSASRDVGEEDDALQRLRERYAAGEIDETEFEHRVERLLETEDLSAPASGDGGAFGTDPERASGDGRASDRGVERETE